MGFVNIVIFLLNIVKKSVQVELDKYMEIEGSQNRVSQQAFSKARQHIKPEAFKEILEISQQKTLDSGEIKRYKGYRLFGIDASLINLEFTKELTEYFGVIKNKSCKARASILCELNDGIIMDAHLEKFSVGERQLALKHISKFNEIKDKKDVIIFDRGYISRELIFEMEQKGINYVIRVPRKYNKEIDITNKPDFYINLEYKKETRKIRVIKVELEKETEVLVTNLKEVDFKADEFKELYFKR